MSRERFGVHSVFETFQGEGINSGRRAVFVRFRGCNAWTGHAADRMDGKGACARWCDTDFASGEMVDVEALLSRMDALHKQEGRGRRLCVLSGGEPMMQVDAGLVAALHAEEWEVAVETNGSVPSTAYSRVDLLTVSPKLGLPLCEQVLGASTAELKVVVPGVVAGDPTFAEGWTQQALVELAFMRQWRAMWLQPQDVRYELHRYNVGHLVTHLTRKAHGVYAQPGPEKEYAGNVVATLDLVRRLGGRWRVGVQAHKMLGLD